MIHVSCHVRRRRRRSRWVRGKKPVSFVSRVGSMAMCYRIWRELAAGVVTSFLLPMMAVHDERAD